MLSNLFELQKCSSIHFSSFCHFFSVRKSTAVPRVSLTLSSFKFPNFWERRTFLDLGIRNPFLINRKFRSELKFCFFFRNPEYQSEILGRDRENYSRIAFWRKAGARTGQRCAWLRVIKTKTRRGVLYVLRLNFSMQRSFYIQYVNGTKMSIPRKHVQILIPKSVQLGLPSQFPAFLFM